MLDGNGGNHLVEISVGDEGELLLDGLEHLEGAGKA